MHARRAPPLNALRVFEAAARLGSFARAADELAVTAAAVSHRVRELEAWLGVALFEREARGIRLTDAGRRYRDDIASALQIIERATAGVDRATVDGPLRVSMPQSFAEHWLAPRLGRLSAELPGLELAIEGTSRLASFRDGNADAGIRFGAGDYPGLDSRYLCGDAVNALAPAAAVANRADARPAAVLAGATLLLDEGRQSDEPWLDWSPWLREAGLPAGEPPRYLKCSDGSIAVTACRQGAGPCLARLSFAHDYLRRRELVALFPWRRTAWANHFVTRPADRGNPRIDAFRDWLLREVTAWTDEIRDTLGIDLLAATAASEGRDD